MILIRLLLIACLLALLSGCGAFKSELGKCHNKQEYQSAAIGPRVQVPSDLAPMDPEIRLVLPEGETNTKATPKTEPCLTDPPSFSERS